MPMRDTQPGASSDAPAMPREVYTLLAQANLLRIRGCWEEAVENCMSALRLAPENASAHSLLGDIYENQGRFDDAIQWYRMALDINPDSPADKLKLGRLLELNSHSAKEPLRSEAIISDRTASVGRLPRPAAQPEKLLRGVTWLAGALFLLVVGLAGAVMWNHHQPSAPITAPSVVVPDPAISPSGTPVAAPQTPASSATVTVSPTSTAAPNAPVAPVTPPDADAAEAVLLTALQQDSQLTSQAISPEGVQIDPRQNSATLTVLCPAAPVDNSLREALLRDAVQTALAGQSAQGNVVAQWTIRCLIPSGTGANSAPTLGFVADITPTALSALGTDPTSLSATQLLPAFQNVWWAPSVTE